MKIILKIILKLYLLNWILVGVEYIFGVTKKQAARQGGEDRPKGGERREPNLQGL